MNVEKKKVRCRVNVPGQPWSGVCSEGEEGLGKCVWNEDCCDLTAQKPKRRNFLKRRGQEATGLNLLSLVKVFRW